MFDKLFKKKQSSYELFISELLKKDSDKKLLEKMLDSGEIDINEKNDAGESFLHICLSSKKQQSALWLISKNISLDTTAFDIAINNQYHKIVKLLLNSIDIDINKKNEFGRTLLQDSVILGDHEMAKILIEHGADINSKDNKNRNVLYDAMSYNNEKFIDYILSFGNLELNNIDTSKDSILNHNSIKNNNSMASKLIDKGANPTLLDRSGKSFLCRCALNGIDGLHLIHQAIEKGFDINSKIKDNHTILMILVDELSKLKDSDDEDRKKVIRYMLKDLISKGLDINAQTIENETVLFKAVRLNDEMLVKLLLESKIDVNIQNNKKQSALVIAVYQGIESIKIIIDLLKHKADPTLTNNLDKTLFEELNDIILHIKYPEGFDKSSVEPKHLSIQYMNILKELLRHCKKDLNFLNSEGNPLFYKPLMYHNTQLFYLYTNKGLDIFKLNKDGHNLFYEYVLKIFEDDNDKVDFKGTLNILMSSKIDHNKQDETGWTVVSKIIATTPCNMNLFKTLIRIVKFDYKIVDKLGRSAIHSAVWKGKVDIVKIINFIDSSVKDIPDNYGILPITYAALLGNKELVLTFIELKSRSTTDLCIAPAAIKKFTPLLKNLDNLTIALNDPIKIRQMTKVIEDIKADFGAKDCEN